MLEEPFIDFRKKQLNGDNKIDKQKQTIKINILKKLFLSGDENLFTKEEIIILHLLFYYLEKITLGDMLLENIKYGEVDLEFRTEPSMMRVFEFDMISEVIYAIIHLGDDFYSEILSCYEKMNPKNDIIIYFLLFFTFFLQILFFTNTFFFYKYLFLLFINTFFYFFQSSQNSSKKEVLPKARPLLNIKPITIDLSLIIKRSFLNKITSMH
jgi:hypothetical protein